MKASGKRCVRPLMQERFQLPDYLGHLSSNEKKLSFSEGKQQDARNADESSWDIISESEEEDELPIYSKYYDYS